jgi:hypothetical protein
LLARPELGRLPIPWQRTSEWLDFVELTLADWIEQVEGAAEKANPLFEWSMGDAWSYRRLAYRQMVEVLCSHRNNDRTKVIKDVVAKVYAVEPEATRHQVQERTPPMSEAAREARDAIESIHL